MAIKQVEFRGVTRFVALNLYCAHLGARARLPPAVRGSALHAHMQQQLTNIARCAGQRSFPYSEECGMLSADPTARAVPATDALHPQDLHGKA